MRKRGGTRRMKLKTRKSRRNKSRNRKIYGGEGTNANANATLENKGREKVKLLIEIAQFLTKNKDNLSNDEAIKNQLKYVLVGVLDEDYTDFDRQDYIGLNKHMTVRSGGTIILNNLLNTISGSSVDVNIAKIADMYIGKINKLFA